MKKVLIVLLMLAVAGAAFADVTGFGRVWTDFGGSVDLKKDSYNHAWIFGISPQMGLRAEGDNVSAWVRWDGVGINANATGFADILTGGWKADATVNLGDFALSTGLNQLCWAQWSNFAFLDDGNYGFGASSSNKTVYIQGAFAGAYFGLAEAGIASKETRFAPFPGFYAGYDFIPEDGPVSAGAAFAGLISKHSAPTAKDPKNLDSTFAFMGNAHAKFSFDPVGLGINIAFYGNPGDGYFTVFSGGDKVLEAMVDAGIGLDACAIGISGALLMGIFDDKNVDNSVAIKIAASASFDLGGGFQLIPGVCFNTEINGGSGLDVGVSLAYSF